MLLQRSEAKILDFSPNLDRLVQTQEMCSHFLNFINNAFDEIKKRFKPISLHQPYLSINKKAFFAKVIIILNLETYHRLDFLGSWFRCRKPNNRPVQVPML